MAPTRTWQEVAKEAQLHRDASIAKVNPPVPDVPAELPLDVTSLPRKLLTEREVEITETPAESLLASLATGKLKSVEVTNAFLRRAGLAQKLVGGSRWLRFRNILFWTDADETLRSIVSLNSCLPGHSSEQSIWMNTM